MWSLSWWVFITEKDESLRTILTLSLILFAVLWFLWTWNNSSNPKPPLPPGPRGLPLLGYLPFLGTNLHHEFTDLARVYGPIYKLQLGTKLCVVVSSPSLVKQVVRDQDTVFANRDPTIAAQIASYGGNDIALASYGPEWRKMRKIFVREMLSKPNLDACYAHRKEEVHKSICHVYNDIIGTQVDMGQLAFWTINKALMRMVWGETLHGEKGTSVGVEFREAVTEVIGLIEKPNISDFFPVLAWLDVQGIEREAKRVVSVTEMMLNAAIQKVDMINKEAAGERKRKDFLQFLLDHCNQEDSATSLTMTQLKAVLTDIIVGGTDTTATTVEWVMTELMQHPHEMEKVQQEVAETVGLNNLVEEHHLPKLHYLDAVIKETIRLHPPLPHILPRCPSQSTTIGGYNIPKGSRVFLNVWTIQRDPSVWPNPLEFRPSRFLNDPTNNNDFDYSGNDFRYLPFGSGRRVCAGLPLAERMLIYVLASFLHSFEWRLPNDAKLDFSERYGVVMKKMTPLVVIPTPRLSKLELYAL